MTDIIVSEELKTKAPGLSLSCIECSVKVEAKNEKLWEEIIEKVAGLSKEISVEHISKMPVIKASRQVYKSCGKDPARYRLSSEALLRRVVTRHEIYQINNVVDALNLVSISTGFSIGGYDAGKISGNVEFGIGNAGEPYVGIGRGELNVEFLPVFRDELGAFGTPTSDSERTSVGLETKQFLMIIIDFDRSGLLTGASQMAEQLLEKYAGAGNFEIKRIN